MTAAKKERIRELEASLEWLLRNESDDEGKHSCINNAYTSHLMFGAMTTEGERAEYCMAHEEDITELRSLYWWEEYVPDEDEKTLDYLFREGMTTEQKLKSLADAWWYATNSGYSDAMANRLMAGEENAQTELWELNCSNRNVIDRYYNWLKEQSEG